MKIVNQKQRQGKLIKELMLNNHVESISKTTEDVSVGLITAEDNTKYFDKPINGKTYITYPLSVIVEVEIKNAKTIGSLLWQVAQAYKTIYKEEEIGARVKTVPIDERIGLINRNQTDGKYGIWGHDIGDLYFEVVQIYDNGIIKLGIGS